MPKFEKIYSVMVLALMIVELIALIIAPVIAGVCTGEWSQLILWVFVPWLAADIYMLYSVRKHWEDIK